MTWEAMSRSGRYFEGQTGYAPLWHRQVRCRSRCVQLFILHGAGRAASGITKRKADDKSLRCWMLEGGKNYWRSAGARRG